MREPVGWLVTVVHNDMVASILERVKDSYLHFIVILCIENLTDKKYDNRLKHRPPSFKLQIGQKIALLGWGILSMLL